MNNNSDRKKIISALEIILQYKTFLMAPKSSAFLRYVVLQTLDGRAARIKAYSIAVDALGRPSTFDPQGDPSVRVMAKRVRDMLSEYYSQTSGHDVILQLNPGSYVPQFIISSENKRSELGIKLTGLS